MVLSTMFKNGTVLLRIIIRPYSPYISCSSMGSTEASSSLPSDDDVEDSKGSSRYVDEGTVLAKRPNGL